MLKTSLGWLSREACKCTNLCIDVSEVCIYKKKGEKLFLQKKWEKKNGKENREREEFQKKYGEKLFVKRKKMLKK